MFDIYSHRGQRSRRTQQPDSKKQVLNHRQAKPQPKANTLRIPSLTSELYQKYIEQAPKGVVTVVLLTGSHNVTEILRAFAEVVKVHRSSRMRFFCASYATYCHWFEEVLRGSSMESIEREKRNKVCSEELFAVLGLFGSRKQFVIFPEMMDSAGGNPHGPSCNGHGRKLEYKTGSEWSHAAAMALDSLGFEDDDDYEGEGTHHVRKRKPSSLKELLDERKFSGIREEEEVENSHRNVQAQTVPVGMEGSANPSDDDSGGGEEGVRVGGRGVAVGCGDHVRWLREGLGVWLERLEDGSLKRYSVDHWPELIETEPIE